MAQIGTGAVELTHHGIELGKLRFIARHHFVNAVTYVQILLGQHFQVGVNIVLCIVDNAVIGQITFNFSGNLGGNPAFFTIANQQFTGGCGVIFQRLSQLFVINFQLTGSAVPVMPISDMVLNEDSLPLFANGARMPF